MALSDEDVREILRIIDESELDELRLETAGFSLHVRRGGAPGAAPADSPGGAAVRPGASTQRAPTEPPPARAPGAAPHPRSGESAPGNGLATIEAPMLGTFYRADGPGGTPFVEVGARVQADTTVCIIEVMKMMNSVPAGVAGTIVEVCSDNAQLVEYGQPLFRVRTGL